MNNTLKTDLHHELLAKLKEQAALIESLKDENAALLKQIQHNNVIPLKEIIAHMPGNVFWKDVHGFFLGCNNNVANLFGLSHAEDIIGKRNQEFIPAQQAQALDEIDQQIMTSKKGCYLEEEGFDGEGHPAIYYSHKIPLFYGDKVVGLLGISLDITQQKKMEEELKIAKEKAEAASLAKTEFVANMSHDIKTPLAGIIGISELLNYRLHNEEREFAQKLLTSGQQLMNFFDNCLEVFKLENGHMVFNKEHFNLSDVLQQIQLLFAPAMKAKQLDFQIRLPQALPKIFFGCRTSLYRILLNLIANAVKFTDDGSIVVSISMQCDLCANQCQIHFTITDTGIGIPLEKQKIIFDRFTRLTPFYKGIYEGNGIGLYIVQQFVAAMHGRITLQSEVGKGSTFVIILPFEISSADLEKTSTLIANKNNVTTSHDTIKILLVEDNLITQRMQSSLLTSMGYEVDVASSGEKVFETFEPGKYQLIFLDIGLPGIPGNIVSKQIRELETGTGFHVPIIALTAHISDDIDYYCRTSGIDDVYSKPLSREQAGFIVQSYCYSATQPE